MLSTVVPTLEETKEEEFDAHLILSNLPQEAKGVKKIFHDAEIVAHSLVYNDELLAQMRALVLDGEIKELKTLQPFSASATFKSEQEYRLYAPSVPIPHPGLVVYFLCPVNSANSNMYVVFRGTKCLDSAKRDVEEYAPGQQSFKESLPELMTSFTKVLEIFAKEHALISITLCGHSLGSADAQNFCTSLLEKLCQVHDLDPEGEPLDKELPWFKQIAYINLTGFNSPGITLKTANAAIAYASLLRAQNLIQLSCYWLHVSGDAVQQTGQIKLFADAPAELVNIHLIKPSHAEITENTWVTAYNPLQIYSAARNTLKAHTSKHFLKINESWTYEYITNKQPEGALAIANKLSKNNSFLQSDFALAVQYALAALMHGYSRITGNFTYSYRDCHNVQIHDVFTYDLIRKFNNKLILQVALPNRHDLRLASPLQMVLKIPFNQTQLLNSLVPPPVTNNAIRLEPLSSGAMVFHHHNIPTRIFDNFTRLIRQPFIATPVRVVEPVYMPKPEPEFISQLDILKILRELNKYIYSISSDANKIVFNANSFFFSNHEITRNKGEMALFLKKLLKRACHLDEFKIHLQDTISRNILYENHKNNLLFKSTNKFGDCLQKLTEIISAKTPPERMRFIP